MARHLPYRPTCLLNTHERSIARPEQESTLDERAQHRRTGGGVEIPETPRLRFRQAESRHFEKFPSDTGQKVDGRRRDLFGAHVTPFQVAYKEVW
jgi:hypothetical protein